jgi:hypothetical protein
VDTKAAVLEAARRRSAALETGDPGELRTLLHPRFTWFSHTGRRFDRDSFIAASEQDGQLLRELVADARVVTHARTAVVHCHAADGVDGEPERLLPVTQVWVRYDDRWVCLAGHIGPSQS